MALSILSIHFHLWQEFGHTFATSVRSRIILMPRATLFDWFRLHGKRSNARISGLHCGLLSPKFTCAKSIFRFTSQHLPTCQCRLKLADLM